MWRLITCMILLGCLSFIYGDNVSLSKKDDHPCGYNVTDKASGDFSLYNKNFTGECVWLLSPKFKPPGPNKTATTSLFIHTLYLHESDAVTVFKNEADVKNDSLSLVKPITRQNGSVTIYTTEAQLYIKFTGNPNVSFDRTFEGLFHGFDCAFPLTDHLVIIHAPIPANNIAKGFTCKYTYNLNNDYRIVPAFIFDKFNVSSSEVQLKGSTRDGPYKHVPAMDFFPQGSSPLSIEVNMAVPSNDSFSLRMHTIDRSCYSYNKFGSTAQFTVHTPENIFENESIKVVECRWIFEHTDPSKVLSVMFDKLHFDNPLDIVAINDGGSENSPLLLQVTASSGNITENRVIRSTGPYLWMAFKASTYASAVTAIVAEHSQGGFHKGSGNISATDNTDDPVFLLEVEEGKIVFLRFYDADIPLPATLSVYDGFDKTNLLATLHGKVWYPVLSRSNKMMLIASNFGRGKFSANFHGDSASCSHMSSSSNENYILSGNCNTSCAWVVPPQDQPNTDLLLNLQFLALSKGDEVKVLKLDSAKTVLGKISSSMSHIPQITTPANVGVMVQIDRAPCQKENSTDVVLVGHSSYLPACGKDLTPPLQQQFQITSPLHPDTYPVFAGCRWKIATAKANLLHLAFHSLKLAPNHCVHITRSADNKTETYEGSDLKEDLFLMGETVVEFDSTNCKKLKEPLPLESSEGFVINGTVTDCGSVLSGKANGEFTVPANKSLCIYKISIPETGEDTNNVVNIISYSISKNDDKGNYELQVYDGNTVRDSKIVNNSNSEIWSKTSNLIFVYKKTDAAKPSTLLTFKYNTISCNSTMQCDNGMCLHPDWRCNGNNDCGDFSDERNCNSVPIPPKYELTGYSVQTFWGTVISMFVIGGLLGVGVPFCYQKYKNGQYRRFGEISIIE